MKVRQEALDILETLDGQIGRNWYKHAIAGRSANNLLQVLQADGVFTTKLDGWIHAATVTTKSIRKYASEANTGLDLERVTTWAGGNSALRWGRWQADFHWKIDTRLWQYILFLKYMRRAYRDAIVNCDRLTAADKDSLVQLVEAFYDEAEVIYCYRIEVIERSRGFAQHPDPTAGSGRLGYTYTVLAEQETFNFEELPLDFLGQDLEPEGMTTTKRAPKPFPAITDDIVAEGLPMTAKQWLQTAQKRGLTDRWLCTVLGDRQVPTRFNGWEAGLEETLRFLCPFARGERAQVDGSVTFDGHDLGDYGVRFGLCQAEFYRRLNGEASQLIDLLECLRSHLPTLLQSRGLDHEMGGSFLERAILAIGQSFQSKVRPDDDLLPELQVARPVHPRYAPVDPVEPLPWTKPNPEGYKARMKRLGYIL